MQTMNPPRWLDDTLLTTKQAAVLLGLTPRFLEMRRYRGGGPEFIRVSGRCVRYLRSDLISWIDARRRTSTSDPGPDSDGETA